MDRVLKLSQSYEPVGVINWKKAIKLVILGKAEVIKEYDIVMRSERSVFNRPAVIRMIKAFKRNHGHVRFNKRNVFTRDGWKCMYCGASGTISSLTIDHILPKSRGGKTTWVNVATCCKKCNTDKSNMLPSEAGLTLVRAPIKPESFPFFLILNDIPEVWKDFCLNY